MPNFEGLKNNVDNNPGLKKEIMERHFISLGQEYSTVLPVENSVVRLEEQNNILASLEAGTPVVVEAYWRQGKTSMLKSLGNQWAEKYEQKPIYIDASKEDYRWKLYLKN